MKSWIVTFLVHGSETVRATNPEDAIRELRVLHPDARILSLTPVGGPPTPPTGGTTPAVLRMAA